MTRTLAMSWNSGVGSPAIRFWKLQSKKDAIAGFSDAALFLNLQKTDVRSDRAYGCTRISTVTCLATTVVCGHRPPHRDGNWASLACNGSHVRRLNLASKKSS